MYICHEYNCGVIFSLRSGYLCGGYREEAVSVTLSNAVCCHDCTSFVVYATVDIITYFMQSGDGAIIRSESVLTSQVYVAIYGSGRISLATGISRELGMYDVFSRPSCLE